MTARIHAGVAESVAAKTPGHECVLLLAIDESLVPLLAGLVSGREETQSSRPDPASGHVVTVRLLASRALADLLTTLSHNAARGPTIIVDSEEALTAAELVQCLQAGLTGCVRSANPTVIENHIAGAVGRWRQAQRLSPPQDSD